MICDFKATRESTRSYTELITSAAQTTSALVQKLFFFPPAREQPDGSKKCHQVLKSIIVVINAIPKHREGISCRKRRKNGADVQHL